MTPKWAYPFHMLHEVCYYNGHDLDHLTKIVCEQYPKEAAMQLEIGLRLRVECFNHEYSVYDIAEEKTWFLQKLVPWMEESVAILLLVEHGEEVEGVGYRYSSTVFYLERKGLI